MTVYDTVVLGDSGSPARGSNHDFHADPKVSKHLDQSISAKEVDPTSHEIANPWLRHVKHFGSGGLREVAGYDCLLQVYHEVRANPKVLGFLIRETDVTKYIAS